MGRNAEDLDTGVLVSSRRHDVARCRGEESSGKADGE